MILTSTLGLWGVIQERAVVRQWMALVPAWRENMVPISWNSACSGWLPPEIKTDAQLTFQDLHEQALRHPSTMPPVRVCARACVCVVLCVCVEGGWVVVVCFVLWCVLYCVVVCVCVCACGHACVSNDDSVMYQMMILMHMVLFWQITNKVSTGNSQSGYEYADQWLLVINSELKCALHYVQSATDLCVATDSPVPDEHSLPEIEATTSLTSRSSACSKVTSKVQKSNTSRPGFLKKGKKRRKIVSLKLHSVINLATYLSCFISILHVL